MTTATVPHVHDFATAAGLGAAALMYLSSDDGRLAGFVAYMAQEAGDPPAELPEAVRCSAELCGMLHRMLGGGHG